jgi:flavin reductase (DIM6/NTAB) family NADH-FMN oxidoreductase RutF
LEPDKQTYRQTMGRFATGVTVMTVQTDSGEPIAMTANAVTSVSLEPLLLLVCVGKKASIAPHILEADSFALSMLSEDQEELSSYFAGIWNERAAPPPFAFLDWEGEALLAGSIAGIACEVHEILEGGDHWIVMGRVTALNRPQTPGKPLIFYNGLYRQLEELIDEFGTD